jgi:hypothetical protein
MDSKWILHSKTFWVNAITALTAILALPELHRLLGAESLTFVVLAQSVLNIALRRFTSEPVTLSKPDGE